MATPSQIYANARHAKRSTGPKTPEGKAKSSKNALRHGLRSEEIVLRSLEFDEDWEAHLQAYIEDTQPVGDVEFKLAEKAAMCLWKQSRAAMMLALAQDTQVEHKAANLIGHREGRKIDIDDRPAIAQRLKSLKCFGLQEPGFDREAAREAWLRIDLTEPQIEAYFRYYNSFERGFFRAYRELEKRRIERKNDAHRAERLELERKKLSMRAPSTPTFGMLVDEFKTKYDDDDLEFLLSTTGLLDADKRLAAVKIQKDRQLEKALAEHRAKKRAEAELLAQAQAASEPEEEYDWDSAPPWDKRHNLVYRDTDDAYVREKSHLHKDDPVVDDEPADELGFRLRRTQETQITCESVLASDSRRGETLVTPSSYGDGLQNPGGRIGGSAPTLIDSDPGTGETPVTPSVSAEELGSNGQERQIVCESVLASQSRRGETPVTPSSAGDGLRNPGGRIGGSDHTLIESDPCRGETPVTPSSYGDGLRNPGGRIGGSAPTLIDSHPCRGETPVTPSEDAEKLGSNGQGTQIACESVTYIEPIVAENALVTRNDVIQGHPINNTPLESNPSQGPSA